MDEEERGRERVREERGRERERGRKGGRQESEKGRESEREGGREGEKRVREETDLLLLLFLDLVVSEDSDCLLHFALEALRDLQHVEQLRVIHLQ